MPMEEWMKGYAHCIVNHGGNDIDDLLYDLDHDKSLMQTNIVRFTLAVGVSSQLLMLKRLHEDGLLIDAALGNKARKARKGKP